MHLFCLPSCCCTIQIHLEGEANDYVGKGMHGGSIALVPPSELLAKSKQGEEGNSKASSQNNNNNHKFVAHENVICGNTCLYGATGGAFHAYGRTGERFAVRNSGAWAVVEGAGDHCCEYMTNGVVGVLGTTGRNVGAGMTGGLAFFLEDVDEKEDDGLDFAAKVSETNLNECLHKVKRCVLGLSLPLYFYLFLESFSCWILC